MKGQPSIAVSAAFAGQLAAVAVASDGAIDDADSIVGSFDADAVVVAAAAVEILSVAAHQKEYFLLSYLQVYLQKNFFFS